MNKSSIGDKMQFKSILQAIIETGEKEHMSKNMAEDYTNEDIKKGTKQGVGQEKRAAEQEAFKLLQSGMCCSEISKITGLSREEIKSLDNKHECSH